VSAGFFGSAYLVINPSKPYPTNRKRAENHCTSQDDAACGTIEVFYSFSGIDQDYLDALFMRPRDTYPSLLVAPTISRTSAISVGLAGW